MTLATYRDLCIDALDVDRLGAFWSAVLGLEPEPGRVGHLGGPTAHHGVWINPVPEPRTVKQRVHLDVHAGSVSDLVRLGATVLDADSFRWTVMADPEGGEFCAFLRDPVPDYRLYEIGVDAVDHASIADWWAGVLGAAVVHDERDLSWVHQIPGAPFESVDFVLVPEPKTVKNRIHWDVETADVDRLVAAGASVLRAPDDEIGWTVMADPEGNEFCAFSPGRGQEAAV